MRRGACDDLVYTESRNAFAAEARAGDEKNGVLRDARKDMV
jgi:hypothetical protein